jgi:hypothetical protein
MVSCDHPLQFVGTNALSYFICTKNNKTALVNTLQFVETNFRNVSSAEKGQDSFLQDSFLHL